MTITPSIDIIIPNYNKAKFLNKCLESVINQSYKNWIIYLIDDFSNDDSKKVLEKYDKIEKIKIFFLNKNYGPYYCRNLGIKKSSSEYVAFLDSDDFWPKDKLKSQLLEMHKNNYEFTFTDLSYFKKNEEEKQKLINLPNFYDYKKFIKHSTMSTSSIILKREIINETTFKDIKHEDYLFKCDLLRRDITAINIKNTFVYYRINKGNRSSNKFSNLINLWKINKRYNGLSYLENMISILSISINSIKNYGWK